MRTFAVVLVFGLTACSVGSSENSTVDNLESSPTPIKVDCRDLLASVIRIAHDNGTNIVKIYNAKKIGGTDVEPICKGDAMYSGGFDRRPIYFRQFTDEDGDSLIQYNDEPFSENAGNSTADTPTNSTFPN